jgi:lipid-binding SYLF domain-containing protein
VKLRILGLGLLGVTLAWGESDSEKRLNAAADMFTETMEMKDQGIPQDLLNKSHCIVLIPGMKKGAFIVGGSYGRGFINCRAQSGVGWSAPASVRLEGGSFGLQIGGSETDLILLVMNEKGVDKLLSSKFTIGADASAAAGPVGRTAAAETDAQMRAEILAWSRTRGAFAGISLKGSTLRPDNSTNKELYGKEVANKDVVTAGMTAPAAAGKLLSILNKYSPRKSS